MSYSKPYAITLNLNWLLARPWRFLAFGLGSGLAPQAPGTVGTLWAWAMALVCQRIGGQWTDLEIVLLLGCGLIIGIKACGQTGEDLGAPDHSGMVWDEMIAFWIILLFILPASWKVQLLAFILFRFFDIAKPGPIGWVDAWFKNWQPRGFLNEWVLNLRGLGVMLDDLFAALFTLIVLSFLFPFISH